MRGIGFTADAHHITAPAPGGEGAVRAMNHALNDGELNLEDVQYINAHGTSTPYNDRSETEAIKTLFGEDVEHIPDPNKPENVPVIKALKKQQIDSLKLFIEGPGKVLFQDWQNELRADMFKILIEEPTDCGCVLCSKRNQMQYLLKLIVKAHSLLEENK